MGGPTTAELKVPAASSKALDNGSGIANLQAPVKWGLQFLSFS